MPELPDVEVFKNYLEQNTFNRKIDRVEVKDKKVLDVSPETLRDNITGHTFKKSERIGKHLLIDYGGKDQLTFHFGMTGFFEKRGGNGPHKYTTLAFHFNGEELDYVSRRKLGKVGFAKNMEEFTRDKDLGPDALGIKWETFRDRMRKKGGKLKARLMDQSLLSGLGNVYSDEILYQEKLHPEMKIADLDDQNLKSLYTTMGRVLKVAIEHNADPKDLPDGYLLANRKEGRECPECGGKIKKIKSAGRSAYVCEGCQKL